MLTPADGKELIKVAKAAVKSYLDKKPYKVPAAIEKKYSDKRGVFVCLKKGNQERGCMGYIEAEHPIWWAVVNAAKGAALEDQRFPPTNEDELPEIDFEISILTEPKLLECPSVDRAAYVKIGTHGLVVEKEQYKGSLLPQIFANLGADAESALDMTCKKAGLKARDWENDDVSVYTFECQTFKN
jgi:AmmeMemoRadiSam system protein A